MSGTLLSRYEPRLAHFAITALHDRQTIRLDFNPDHTIFIADNGAGKTTSLYLLQSVLSQEWSKATRFAFSNLQISFDDGSIFRIDRREILDRPFISRLLRYTRHTSLSEKEIRSLLNKSLDLSFADMRNDRSFRDFAIQAKISTARAYDILQSLRKEGFDEDDLFGEDSELGALRAYLREYFPHAVIYLPTYRRIEQELSLLTEKSVGEDDDLFSNSIQFGMKDVRKRIEDVAKSVREHLALTYASISGQMLHHLTRPTSLTKEMRRSLEEIENIEAVLARLSNYISKEDRDYIVTLARDGQVQANTHLAFFLSKLIDSYHEIRDAEDSLEFFSEKCNSYLTDKKFRYEPSSASLKLYEDRTGVELNLGALSSGEKQLIGVISQVYLSESATNVIIFDEPELSLSVEWQRKLLPDLVASPKCWSLIAATHSPFVFENQLDSRARSLWSARMIEGEG